MNGLRAHRAPVSPCHTCPATCDSHIRVTSPPLSAPAVFPTFATIPVQLLPPALPGNHLLTRLSCSKFFYPIFYILLIMFLHCEANIAVKKKRFYPNNYSLQAPCRTEHKLSHRVKVFQSTWRKKCPACSPPLQVIQPIPQESIISVPAQQSDRNTNPRSSPHRWAFRVPGK